MKLFYGILILIGIMGLCMAGMECEIFWKQTLMNLAGLLLFFISAIIVGMND